MSEYTEGEWKILTEREFKNIRTDYEGYIAELGKYYIVSDESLGSEKADAQLIATAPELLHTLEWISSIKKSEFQERPEYWMKKCIFVANAAIKKAKGD